MSKIIGRGSFGCLMLPKTSYIYFIFKWKEEGVQDVLLQQNI